MKKLFLTSSFADAAPLFSAFEQNLSGKTVTFIPTASMVEFFAFYVKTGRKALRQLGLTVDELDVAIAPAEEIAAKIKGNDFIYITGGNTFFLLQELKRTGADKMIAEAVNAGKPYIGESAGSIVTAPNIEYVKGMDSVKKAPGLNSFDALGLVDFYTVPHHTNMPFKKIVENIIKDYSNRLKLTPISNKQAICVEGESVNIRLIKR